MSEKKVISIRFSTDNESDMELYLRMEKEAGMSASLASIAKARIKESYDKQDIQKQNMELLEMIAETIRKEIQGVNIKTSSAYTYAMRERVEISQMDESKLPEKSENLPYGALDFLE